MSASSQELSMLPIQFWQHWRAVHQIYHDYPPGADVLVDQIRSSGFLARSVFRLLLAPLYFAREQGWAVQGEHGEMAAIMYLRRGTRQGIRVLHVDELSVHTQFRGRGLAQRLLAHAEGLAQAEQRPFMTLAVTITNTPAVTLYHRLGYQEQHHSYFTFVPSFAVRSPSSSPDIRQRRVARAHAANVFQRFAHQEVTSCTPEVANLLAAYYPQGVGLVGSAIHRTQAYIFEHQGEPLGYGDGYQRRGQWNLRLGLPPEVWGTPSEGEMLQMLTRAIGPEPGSTVVLHVPSVAHFAALCSGTPSLASELGLHVQQYARMVMIKRLAKQTGLGNGQKSAGESE